MVSRPFQPTVVIEWLGSNKSTVSTYLDESQSTMKENLDLSYSGSGAGNPLLVQRSIARQVGQVPGGDPQPLPGVAGGVRGQGQVRGGVAGQMEGGERGRQDLLQQGREELVQVRGDLGEGWHMGILSDR